MGQRVTRYLVTKPQGAVSTTRAPHQQPFFGLECPSRSLATTWGPVGGSAHSRSSKKKCRLRCTVRGSRRQSARGPVPHGCPHGGLASSTLGAGLFLVFWYPAFGGPEYSTSKMGSKLGSAPSRPPTRSKVTSRRKHHPFPALPVSPCLPFLPFPLSSRPAPFRIQPHLALLSWRPRLVFLRSEQAQ
jgi:hypothetical protein